jgi:TRAP-type C4-dicarboxylate transport system permease small subunit
VAGAGISQGGGDVKAVLTRPVEWLCGALMVAVTAVVFLQVMSRYVFHHPFDWPEELARYLFVWVALLGAALALARGAHFGIDALVRRFSPAARTRVALAVHVGLAVFLVRLVQSGWQLAVRVKEQPSPAMEVSMTYPYLAIPVSFAVMLLFTLADLYKLAVTRREGAA